MSGQIFFCGDTHSNFGHVLDLVNKHRPAAIVFLGDLQAQAPLQEALYPILDLTEIWWIHGNHDTDSDADYDNLFGSTLADRNLHGRVVDIAGRRIAGLGGIFRGQIWMPGADPRPEERNFESSADFLQQCGKGNRWRDGLPRKHRSSIFPAEYDALATQRADILVTHEAPSCHPQRFKAIDDLARAMRVQKAYHGHHHDRIDYSREWGSLSFQAIGVGFCGVTDQDGNVLLVGDFDEQRAYRRLVGD